MTDSTANELVGQLTLADSMLGELVGDMRKILAYANWPGTVREPTAGVTTGRAAEKLAKELGHEAALYSAALVVWIAQVEEVTELRNRVVHAIALNQCMKCGQATMFRHPASGDDVDRSPEVVASIVARYETLLADGLSVAEKLSEAVNQRILAEAKKIANALDQIQNPPQVYPHHVEHLCPACTGSQGKTVVHVGAAVVVVPSARWLELSDGRWPPRDNT